jgi:hypothetical protein
MKKKGNMFFIGTKSDRYINFAMLTVEEWLVVRFNLFSRVLEVRFQYRKLHGEKTIKQDCLNK